MKRNRVIRSLVSGLALTLLPGLIRAEVSVDLDRAGNVKRVVYLTRDRGVSPFVWRQVRPRVPSEQILNPLGDTLGDLKPLVRLNPADARPWAVWSMNLGGVKRIGFAAWGGKAWTAPRPITPENPYQWDEFDPRIAFDASGTPFVVWWSAEQVSKVYFSTMIAGVWTPPLLISDPAVDSRTPTIGVLDTTAFVTYQTPAGPVTAVYDAAILLKSAAQLMDSPIPPGFEPDPGNGGGSGNSKPLPFRK